MKAPLIFIVQSLLMNPKLHPVHPGSSSRGCQSWYTTVSLLSLRLEHNLHPEFLEIRVPPRKVPVIGTVYLSRLQLESTRLIGFRRHKHVLIVLVRRIVNLLLIRTHESDLWCDIRRDLRVLKLENQALLSRNLIPRLRNLVARPSNLDHVPLNIDLCSNHPYRHPSHRIQTSSSLLLLLRCTAREVRLMLAALGVGEVGAIILVDCQAEPTLEGSDVVLEEVGVFVEIDGLESELSETLSSVCIGC